MIAWLIVEHALLFLTGRGWILFLYSVLKPRLRLVLHISICFIVFKQFLITNFIIFALITAYIGCNLTQLFTSKNFMDSLMNKNSLHVNSPLTWRRLLQPHAPSRTRCVDSSWAKRISCARRQIEQ